MYSDELEDTLIVSTVDYFAPEVDPQQYEQYYQQTELYRTAIDDFVGSEHHYYCYSHSEQIDDPYGASYVEEVYDVDDDDPNLATIRPERRVEFVDIRRRRSRLASIWDKSRRQARVNENDEEEMNSDDPDDAETSFSHMREDPHVNRRESDLLRFIRSARNRSPSLGAFRSCKRSQIHRVSLLGRPIHVRHPRHTNPYYKQIQNEVHNFLERPRGWKAMSYHIIM